MKLRNFLILLLLLNAGFLAWSQGGFADLGWPAANDREPAYIQQQVRPEMLSLQADVRTRKIAKINNPTRCLTTSVFALPAAKKLAAQAQEVLPAGSWTMQDINTPGQWMIYMGRYPDSEAVERKKIELRRLRISSDLPVPASYQPGISLGAFNNYEQAQEAQKQVIAKGARSARLVTEIEPVLGQQLRIEQADSKLEELLQKLRPAMNGQSFQPCA